MTLTALGSLLLVLVGLYALLLKRNVLKMAMGVVLMSLGVAVFVATTGAIAGDWASVGATWQTLALIAVVGGASVASLMVVTAVRLREKCGTLDVREMRRLKG